MMVDGEIVVDKLRYIKRITQTIWKRRCGEYQNEFTLMMSSSNERLSEHS